jgi:hypothetical protein
VQKCPEAHICTQISHELTLKNGSAATDGVTLALQNSHFHAGRGVGRLKLTEVESSLPDIPPLNLPVLYSSEACAIR